MKLPFFTFRRSRGITLVELVVAIAIIAVVIAILLPVFRKVRQKAKTVQNKNNQRQIVMSLNYYAQSNDGKYPESVAKTGGENIHWDDPRMLVSVSRPSHRKHRAVSEYLAGFVEDFSIMYCPSSPEKPADLKDLWQAGDRWDNPQTPEKEDIFVGSYCFYWNYTGYVEGRKPFKGPGNIEDRGNNSHVMVSDYFGYDHRLYPQTYTSCERFEKANKSTQTSKFPSLWSSGTMDQKADMQTFNLSLNAGFTDGHVETYGPENAVIMQASWNEQGTEPWPEGMGPGEFYLPPGALE